MATASRCRLFLDVNIGEEGVGRLTIELFTDKAPKTCENFRRLCTGGHNGLSYARTPFHRVIDDFMIQGGDIACGDGTGVTSIYGQEFEDENLHWRDMDAAGLVCSANRGRDTNGSQFFITLEPTPHLNGKHTIFGRLVGGEDTLRRIAKVHVDDNDRPLQPVLVSRCGELERRKRQKAPSEAAEAPASDSRDRGRRRKSNASDQSMSVSPKLAPPRRGAQRRQSDNVVDEGLRGRTRQRSGSHSSNPIEEDSQAEGPESPVELHKRKRSVSPSRHVEKDRRERDGSGNNNEQRRRRSLPNQYAEQRDHRARGEDARYRPSPRREDNRYASHKKDDGYRGRRDYDQYRPSRDRASHGDDSRLGGGGRLDGAGGGYEENEPPVKFKGRGIMKYREPDRW